MLALMDTQDWRISLLLGPQCPALYHRGIFLPHLFVESSAAFLLYAQGIKKTVVTLTESMIDCETQNTESTRCYVVCPRHCAWRHGKVLLFYSGQGHVSNH